MVSAEGCEKCESPLLTLTSPMGNEGCRGVGIAVYHKGVLGWRDNVET